MRRTRRHADWRPVATRRMPARWVGLLVGMFAFAVLTVLWHRTEQLIIMGSTALAAFVSNRVAARRLDGLRDEGEDRQFAATLGLKRTTTYGHDEGFVSFEDGYLIYMGRRCAFSLGARDVHMTKIAATELEFAFRGPGGKHVAHLQLKKNDDFITAVMAWQSRKKRSCEGVLPPVLPDPAFPRALVVFMNALPPLALSASFLALRSSDAGGWLFHLVLSAISLVIALGFAAVQAGELGRIAKGQPRGPLLDALLRKRRLRRSNRTKAELPAPGPTATPSQAADAPTAEIRTGG